MWQAERAYRDSIPLIMAMAKNAGMDEPDREEILQRVGVVLVEKASEYDPSRGTRRMWIAGIAHNILLDALRAARVERRRRGPERRWREIPSDDLTPEQTLRGRESLILLRESVREELRAAFDLDAEGHTSKEVGRILDIPARRAEWDIREARKDLDRALERMGESRESVTRIRAIPFFPLLFGERSPAPSTSFFARVLQALRLATWAPSFAAAALSGSVIGGMVAVAIAGSAGLDPARDVGSARSRGVPWEEAAAASGLRPPADTAASGSPADAAASGLRPPAEAAASGLRPPADAAASGLRPPAKAAASAAPLPAASGGVVGLAAAQGGKPRDPAEAPLRKVGRHKWMMPTAILSVSMDKRKYFPEDGSPQQSRRAIPRPSWNEPPGGRIESARRKTEPPEGPSR